MIEYNSLTQQDFLKKELAQKLQDAGIDMSDSKYYICCQKTNADNEEGEYITLGKPNSSDDIDYIPTYTVMEIMNKIPESFNTTIKGIESHVYLKVSKGSKQYKVYYTPDRKSIQRIRDKHIKIDRNRPAFVSQDKHLINALARMLLLYTKRSCGILADHQAE